MFIRYLLMVLFIFAGSAVQAQPRHLSEYSSLEPTHCKELPRPKPPEGEPDDSFQRRCPPHDGYDVEEVGGDMRSWLVLSKGGSRMDFAGTGAEEMVFPNLHPGKLEWRYRVVSGKKELLGVIFRMTGQNRQAHDAGDYKSRVSRLYAVRLNAQGFCLQGSAKTNEEARGLLDKEDGCRPQAPSSR